MALFQKSCCGCTLQTGSKIIAIYCIISRCIAVIVMSALLAKMDYDLRRSCDYHISYRTRDCWKNKSALRSLRPSVVYILTWCVILLILDALLLRGIKTQRRGFVLPWIVFQMFSLIGYLITIIVASSNVAGSKYFSTIISNGVVFGIIGLGLNIYFILIVISYYQKLREPGFINSPFENPIDSPQTPYIVAPPAHPPNAVYDPRIPLYGGVQPQYPYQQPPNPAQYQQPYQQNYQQPPAQPSKTGTTPATIFPSQDIPTQPPPPYYSLDHKEPPPSK